MLPLTPSRRSSLKSQLTTPRRLIQAHLPTPVKISPRYVNLAHGLPSPRTKVDAKRKLDFDMDAIVAQDAARQVQDWDRFQKQQAERRKKLACASEAEAEASGSSEEEEKIQDLGDLLAEAKARPVPAPAPETTHAPIRQSTRIRSASMGSAAAKSGPKSNVLVPPRRPPSDFDKFMRKMASDQRRGVSGWDMDAALASIREDKALEKGKKKRRGSASAYPNPLVSGTKDDSEEEEEEVEEDEELEEMVEDSDAGQAADGTMSRAELRDALAMVPDGLVDHDLLREATESRDEIVKAEDRADGFWDGPQQIPREGWTMPVLDMDAGENAAAAATTPLILELCQRQGECVDKSTVKSC